MRKTIATFVISAIAIIVPSTIAQADSTGVWTGNFARDEIIRRESSGNPYAVNPSSGTQGIYQCHPRFHSCPSLGDVQGQHNWGQRYMESRYGSWSNALAHHNRFGWW